MFFVHQGFEWHEGNQMITEFQFQNYLFNEYDSIATIGVQK